MTASPLRPDQRLYFLDWIRIIAFLVLILYHTGMYYVTWDWHVKSPDASHAIEPLMILSAPWRLGLLFMISGVATAFMLGKLHVGSLLAQRSWRLLVPLAFGMLVIVPPQAYFEVVEKVAYQGGYGEFLQLYITSYKGFCRGDDCLAMPTWNHLWFVAYLWVYTMLFGTLAWLAAGRLHTWSAATARVLTGWKLFVIPVVILLAARIGLAEHFPSTHALTGDWYNHAQYFFLFVLGALLATQRGTWAETDRLRWTSLALWLGSWAILVVCYSMPHALMHSPAVAPWRPLMSAVYCLNQWAPILAGCGFAHHHVTGDSTARRYLTEAVFPVYILHQTLIVTMAHWLKPIHLAPAVEGAVLVILTLTISFGVFELVRRVTALRPLFGLGKPRSNDYTSGTAPAIAQAVNAQLPAGAASTPLAADADTAPASAQTRTAPAGACAGNAPAAAQTRTAPADAWAGTAPVAVAATVAAIVAVAVAVAADAGADSDADADVDSDADAGGAPWLPPPVARSGGAAAMAGSASTAPSVAMPASTCA
jgi:surface polysaccharide O-acyltransferase-like enzyme